MEAQLPKHGSPELFKSRETDLEQARKKESMHAFIFSALECGYNVTSCQCFCYCEFPTGTICNVKLGAQENPF